MLIKILTWNLINSTWLLLLNFLTFCESINIKFEFSNKYLSCNSIYFCNISLQINIINAILNKLLIK